MGKRLNNGALAALVAALLVTRLMPTTATGTTVIPPTFEELADRADLVFVGRCAEVRSEWRSTGTRRVIVTLVAFETQEVLKGNAGATVTLQFLGGRVGDVKLEVSEIPRFEAGDRVLLFVEGNGIQFCPLVGLYHGRFRVAKDTKTGRDVLLRHDGKPLRDLAEIGIGPGTEFVPGRTAPVIAADRGPMGLDEFKDHVRAYLEKRRTR